MLRKLWIGLGLVILAVSIVFLVWGYWPARREIRVRPVPDPAGFALPEDRILTLVFPPQIRAGDVGLVRLTWGPHPDLSPTPENVTGQGGGPSEFYDSHDVIAEARFDIPGMNVRPSELISAPITRGQTAVFYWTLRPGGEERARGTIWLYLRSVDRLTGEESREAVSAQIVEIESLELLGLPVNLARLAGWVGAVTGFLLCMPHPCFRASPN